jgi:hypothetical protein
MPANRLPPQMANTFTGARTSPPARSFNTIKTLIKAYMLYKDLTGKPAKQKQLLAAPVAHAARSYRLTAGCWHLLNA